MKRLVYLLPLLLLTSACSSLLPQAHTESTSFEDFDQARTLIEGLVPMKSDRLALKRSGFDPAVHPNTKMLTHADVIRILLPTTLLTREDLDPGILVCLKSRDACYGMEINASKIAKVRNGNFLADFSNFSRRTETTGWRFNALILFVNNIVVYRSWGGQPTVSEIEIHTNPLGPLQDVGPSLMAPR